MYKVSIKYVFILLFQSLQWDKLFYFAQIINTTTFQIITPWLWTFEHKEKIQTNTEITEIETEYFLSVKQHIIFPNSQNRSEMNVYYSSPERKVMSSNVVLSDQQTKNPKYYIHNYMKQRKWFSPKVIKFTFSHLFNLDKNRHVKLSHYMRSYQILC